MAKNNGTTEIATTTPDTGAALGLINPATFADKLKSGFSVTRDFKFEDPGQTLHGFFLGAGTPIEVDSQRVPGTKDTIATWRVKDPGGAVTWLVMGSVGLDKYVASLAPNTEVMIQFIGTKKVKGGRNMNDFVVATK